MNNNEYHEKLQEYIHFAQTHMYIFEVIGPDASRSFVFMYKEETIVDLYNKILFHFGCRDIKALYYYSQSGENIRLNHRPTITLVDFIQRVAVENNAMLETISNHPNPPVYRLFFEE